MRVVLLACLLILTAASAFAGSLKVSLAPEPYTVFRQTLFGREREVVLRFMNAGEPVSGGMASIQADGRTIECPLEPIPRGESHDIVWAPADARKVRIVMGESVRWSGELPAASKDKTVAIPLSRPIKTIPPLSIHGTNYLPAMWPWPGLFREATVQDYDRDFALMRKYHMNTMRTFAFYDTEPKYHLYRKDGSATTIAQKKLNDLLTIADKYHIKVVLCPGALPPLEDIGAAKRMSKTIFGPFRYDGRILMFDVMNEPGGSDGPKANPTLSKWLQEMYAYTRALLPNHLLTIGLCWQFDQLWDLGVKPDVAQYHNYSGAIGRQPKDQPPVRNVSDDLKNTQAFVGNRPLYIGEFGHSSAAKEYEGVGEERQREIYQGVLEGAEDQKIAGVTNWTLFDFVPDWMGKKEQVYGIVRTDGSLKPSGELLVATYERWAREHPAPWDPR